MTFGAGAQSLPLRMYVFGHSLIDHRPPLIATPSDETTVPHWLHKMSESAGRSVAIGGQYGFLTNHDDLNLTSQWGYDQVAGVWDPDEGPFAEADVNTVLITAANFIQYVAPDGPHPLDAGTSVIGATSTVFDYVNQQEANVRYYIYGNWPEMDLAQEYPPTEPSPLEIAAYHEQTVGDFATWWTTYQDLMLEARPAYNVRLIPVGSIVSKLLTGRLAGRVPFADLYEDSAPHGRPTLYFLASAVTYMAIHQERLPTSFMPDSSVHVAVRNDLPGIVDFIWAELQDFNLPSGESRVFFDQGLPITLRHLSASETARCEVEFHWLIDEPSDFAAFEIEGRSDRSQYRMIKQVPFEHERLREYRTRLLLKEDFDSFRLKLLDLDGSFTYSKQLPLSMQCREHGEVFPNPVPQGEQQVTLTPISQQEVVEIIDQFGRRLHRQRLGDEGLITLTDLPTGVYLLRSNQQPSVRLIRL